MPPPPPPLLVVLRSLRLAWWVWRAGFPLSSCAGTPFHVVRALCGLGLGALLVRAAGCVLVRSLSLLALLLSRSGLPPLFSMRALRDIPLQRAIRAVPCGSRLSAFSVQVPALLFLSGEGGGGSGPRSTLLSVRGA